MPDILRAAIERLRSLKRAPQETKPACRQVFETAELLEKILLNLTAEDLIKRVQGASRLFQHAIVSSKKLHDHFTFRDAPSVWVLAREPKVNEILIRLEPRTAFELLATQFPRHNKRNVLKLRSDLSSILSHPYGKASLVALPMMVKWPTIVTNMQGTSARVDARFEVRDQKNARFILTNIKGSWVSLPVLKDATNADIRITVGFSVSPRHYGHQFPSHRHCDMEVILRPTTMGNLVKVVMQLVAHYKKLAPGRNHPSFQPQQIQLRVPLLECLDASDAAHITRQPRYQFSASA